MERWRSERELAVAEWWTREECIRHLGIDARTFRRYRAAGLEVHQGRIDGKRVEVVRRIDAQAHFRERRRAERAGKRSNPDP